MAVVGRARPWRASWARSPRHAHGSCVRTVGEDGTNRRGPQVSEREHASERVAPVSWAGLVVREKATGARGRGKRRRHAGPRWQREGTGGGGNGSLGPKGRVEGASGLIVIKTSLKRCLRIV
jgi:hypothetical protein